VDDVNRHQRAAGSGRWRLHEASFLAEPGSVANVRRFVSESLGDSNLDLRDEILLVVSELASNALRHAEGRSYAVGVQQIRGGVRVTVTDRGGGLPAPREPETADLAGRGLRIVDAFSTSWGVHRISGGRGKSVWSEVLHPGS
jgi:serine/threonine-protein kinase RsbW